MCNFLRRSGDYGITSATGVIGNVTVHSSIPNMVVSYSNGYKDESESLIRLKNHLAELKETNPRILKSLKKLDKELFDILNGLGWR